jgi:hypothetical protein
LSHSATFDLAGKTVILPGMLQNGGWIGAMQGA